MATPKTIFFKMVFLEKKKNESYHRMGTHVKNAGPQNDDSTGDKFVGQT